MAERLLEESSINKPLVGIAIAVALAAIGGWYYAHLHSASPQKVPQPAASIVPAAPPEDAIAHPVPADASQAPLPPLADSDKAASDAISEASADSGLVKYLVPESLIRHIVVTVDNLPRQKAAVEKRPTIPVAGTFMVNGDELHATLDTQNFRRYTPMVDALGKIDMPRLAAAYLHFYPLFQKAYQDLGYPNGYFNDRLVQVIDGLLATPPIAGPIDLVRPNVMYVFADSALESRPAGQKILIRIGPDNAAIVKAKLTELRAIITAAPLKQ
jgi:hypothetical protein